MNSHKESTNGQSLCLSCGLCCDGTLFGRVSVKPSDNLSALKKASIAVLTDINKKGYFHQSCAALKEKCCQIYPERPNTCRKFRCQLLKKFENGDIPWSEAREKIIRVQKLAEDMKNEISTNLPEYKYKSFHALLKVIPEHQEIAADSVLCEKWKKILMYSAVLLDNLRTDFHFLQNKSEKLEE